MASITSQLGISDPTLFHYHSPWQHVTSSRTQEPSCNGSRSLMAPNPGLSWMGFKAFSNLDEAPPKPSTFFQSATLETVKHTHTLFFQLQASTVCPSWGVISTSLSALLVLCSSSPSTVYEAGKAAKAGYPPSVSGVPGPYSIPSVPLGGAPSSGMLMDKPHPPPLAPSDSTGGSHSGKCSSRLPCPMLLSGFCSGSLLIRTISSVILLWKTMISIPEMGSLQLYQMSSGVQAFQRTAGCSCLCFLPRLLNN